jgi:hypothetical protein
VVATIIGLGFHEDLRVPESSRGVAIATKIESSALSPAAGGGGSETATSPPKNSHLLNTQRYQHDELAIP